jgi:hypothetical protein
MSILLPLPKTGADNNRGHFAGQKEFSESLPVSALSAAHTHSETEIGKLSLKLLDMRLRFA